MRALAPTTDTSDLILRLRRVLSAVDLEGGGSSALRGALARFTALESRRHRRKALADAREQKDLIIARLAFLAELDEINDQETDVTVFEETALLFDEILTAAASAAVAIRSIACALPMRKQ